MQADTSAVEKPRELAFHARAIEGGLEIGGDLDRSTGPQLTAALSRTSFASELILDVSELTFVDSAGLRLIFEFAHTLNGDGPLVLRDPIAAVTRVLEIVGMDRDPRIEIRHTESPSRTSSRRSG